MAEQWRLIYDPPLSGQVNMDRDLEILKSVEEGGSPPTLRFYRWAPPALSLGRFQKADEAANIEACRRLGVDIVRRPTGGRAVLHHRELTYSIIIPDRRPLIPKGVLPAYRFLNQALLTAFKLLGIETELAAERTPGPRLAPGSCFDTSSAYELRVAGKKVVGSAQVRKDGVLLQHGSILLKLPLEIYRQVLKLKAGREIDYLESLGREAAGLWDLGYQISEQELAGALATGFARLFNVEWDTRLPLIPSTSPAGGL